MGTFKWSRTEISCRYIKLQWGITLEGSGSAELPMQLLEWQSTMSELIEYFPLCFLPLTRTNASFESFISPVNNCLYESLEQIQSTGITAFKSHCCFPCSQMTLTYSRWSYQPTIAHTNCDWQRRKSNSNISVGNSCPRASSTQCEQKLLHSSLPSGLAWL